MSRTYMAKASEIQRKWYVVDAAGIPLGRLASQVASVLRGKNKPIYTPHVDCGDHVIVINCDKAVLTGKKLDKKIYSYYTGHVGGRKEIPYRRMMEEKSDLAVYSAIKGMLPKNSLGKDMIRKLRVYKDDRHNHQAQQPEVLKLV